MNKVTGKILLHEIGIGIPNLVVNIYDVDCNTLPKDVIESNQATLANFWDQLEGDRLGSVLTDEDGAFVLEYEDGEFKEKRPDLVLFVTAPENPGSEGCSPILHVSCGIRQNAGRLETYVVKLPIEKLKEAGVSILGIPLLPPHDSEIDELVSKMKQLADDLPFVQIWS